VNLTIHVAFLDLVLVLLGESGIVVAECTLGYTGLKSAAVDLHERKIAIGVVLEHEFDSVG